MSDNGTTAEIPDAKPSPAPQHSDGTNPLAHKATDERLAADPHAGMRLASNGVWQPSNRPYKAGRRKAFGVVTNDTQYRAQQLARNGTEQVLLSIFTRNRGDMPPPLPPQLPERDLERFYEILTTHHEITDDDSEELKVQKEILAAAKDEMAKFLESDPDARPEDFLQYYHDELTRCYFKRTDAQRYVFAEAEKGESEEVIAALVEKINAGLEAEGIDTIGNPFDIVRDSAEANAAIAEEKARKGDAR